jgi:hypothetical protein
LTPKKIAAGIRKNLRESETSHQENLPNRVKIAPRFRDDLSALQTLFSELSPPKRQVRSNGSMEVFYGFGYASAVGHAPNFQGFRRGKGEVEAGDWIHYRYGH